MRALASLLLLLLPVLLATPPAGATIDACTEVAQTPFPPVLVDLVAISGRLAYMDGSCNGTGVVGGPWPGLPQCLSPAVHAAGSTYCGPFVPPGMTVVCTYIVDSGPIEFLTVGFDRNNDGHVFAYESAQRLLPTAQASLAANLVGVSVGSYVLTNDGGPGRVIAYPTAVAPGPPGSARVSCA